MTIRTLDKVYDPRQVEERWGRFWIEKGLFHASPNDPGQPYCIVIPPPNVTGSLHVGHALNNSLQDILIRWRRMQGWNVLWMPGTDHAGIATQNVVEKQLTQEGASREALGRDRFLDRVWQWKAKSGDTIIQQLKRLGASCDWERTRFTMDEGLSRAVREVFVRLYEEGLIYRGERLINWCPRCLTALSDIEVEHEESKGKLYTIEYPVADDRSLRLTVATTRPETMLGDTAVAVHPDDDRYRRLIGRKVRVPLTSRTIPIVGDSLLVDREFGTGAVKITPAHDFNDFDAGERHRLPRLPIFDYRAHLDRKSMQEAEVDALVIDALASLPVSKARPRIEQFLRDGGFLQKAEDHKMAVGKCYRCKTVVEPYLSPQWFVKIGPLAAPAVKAVEEGRIRIIPEGWINNYLGWMRDIKDWCISRQIWWGHQIPAWYCRSCNGEFIKESALIDSAFQGGDRTYAPKRLTVLSGAKPIVAKEAPTHCPDCGAHEFLRDPDVLDTWFSSALWPFSTLGWPDQTAELKTYYPTAALVTGLDILFFWVARMIMMGLKFMSDVPFRDVYIHALVRDAEGQKMSKSKGNVIDPLGVMDQYGTDALRFTLASMASPGRDIKLAEERIEGYRNFANKIWNVARFVHLNLNGDREARPVESRSFADRWILSRLNAAIRAVSNELEQYRFDRAASSLYHFIWHEYCDWYLELIKPALQQTVTPEANRTRQTLAETFERILRLLHPFMPFITEEIWQTLPHEGDSIVRQPYPIPIAEWDSKEVEEAFTLLSKCLGLVRTGRALLNYAPGTTVAFYACGTTPAEQDTLMRLRPQLTHLGRGSVAIGPRNGWPTTHVLYLVSEGITVGVAVEGDVDLQKALDRIGKQRSDADKEASRIEGKLGSADFTVKAPSEVVAEHHDRLKMLRQDATLLASSESQIRTMLTSRGT
jgi:valyl-tRNA synthetase